MCNFAKEQTAKQNTESQNLERQNPLGYNGASVTWEQLYESRLGTIVPVLLGNNHAILTGEHCTSVTWE